MSGLWKVDYLFDPKFNERREGLRKKCLSSNYLNVGYRVINHWADLGLLRDGRLSPNKWRKFSVVDVVWAHIIHELREYGFPLAKVLMLKESIYDYEKVGRDPSYELEFRVFAIMSKINVRLLVYKNGFGTFIDTPYKFTDEYISGILGEVSGRESYILINLNEIVQRIFTTSDLSVPFVELESLTYEEFEMVNFIRFHDYEEVRVKFVDGKIDRLEGKKREKTNRRLIDIIRENDYQNIDVRVSEGNIVSIERTVKKRPSKHGKKPAK